MSGMQIHATFAPSVQFTSLSVFCLIYQRVVCLTSGLLTGSDQQIPDLGRRSSAAVRIALDPQTVRAVKALSQGVPQYAGIGPVLVEHHRHVLPLMVRERATIQLAKQNNEYML